MLLRSLFLKTVRDLRGQIWGWGLGSGSLALMVAALYPSFKDQMGVYADMMKGFPAALTAFFGDIAGIGTWSGWLNIEFFSWVPPILAVFAVVVGTGLIAGEEDKGTLDLLLSQPIRRRRVLLGKFAGFAVATLLICVLIALCLWSSALMVGETQGLGRLLLAAFDIVPITLASGGLALMASVLFRQRRTATSLAVVVVIGSWFLESLGKVVNVLKPYRSLALFHYYNGGAVLSKGENWANVGVLLGLTVLFVLAALLAFERRDIAV
jgi:ABC-2 type transport system permease protein